MAKNKNMDFVNVIVGLAAVLGSIAIGMAMVDGILAVPIIGILFNQIAGWIIIAGGILQSIRIMGFMK